MPKHLQKCGHLRNFNIQNMEFPLNNIILLANTKISEGFLVSLGQKT
eukprot:UN09789